MPEATPVVVPRAMSNFFVRTMTAERWVGVTVRDAYAEYIKWSRRGQVKPVSLRDFRRDLFNAGWRWPKKDGLRDVLQLTR